MNARLQLVRTFLVCGTLISCSGTPAFGDDVQSRIDDYFNTRFASSDLRIEILLSRKGQPLVQSRYENGRLTRMSSNHEPQVKFPVGAIGEQFITAAILRLEKQDKIRLDESVCDYLSQCPKAWSAVKIVHLLTHASGLPLPKHSVASPTNSSSPESVHSLLADVDTSLMAFKPGTVVRYNELDFEILNVFIGKLSGQPPEKYIETELFHPHEIVHTKCSAWGGAASTLEDLYRWELDLTDGKIISRYLFDQMLIPYRDGYALGWKIVKEFDRRLALQVGETEGVSVSIRMYPDDGTFIIVVAHGASADADPLSHDIAAITFGRNYPLSKRF